MVKLVSKPELKEEARMSKQFDKLVVLLKELFQLDQPDLDFGLYRIMHAKTDEITQFLEKDLLPQVKDAFSQYMTADKADLENQLKKAIEQANDLGVDPETTAKVKELRQKIANESVDVGALETEVYDHLYSFFRRYYDEGDFLAKRVYKPGVYAIPYEGEEVTLHWANRDQYYIKTSEHLRDYAFALRPSAVKDPMRVHFRLVEASEGEHSNVKAAEGNDRVFILAPEDFIASENGELVLGFHYRPAAMTDWSDAALQSATAAAAKKPPLQRELLADAVKRVLVVDDPALKTWIDELSQKHVKANGETAEYSRLEGHLNRFVARNTFDYFIHKDLGGFLRRELDFFVKNEIMHLDDIESESATRVEQYLSKIKIIRKIAHKLIDFLAQLEDFQKKLWVKKKFVVETRYCITLGRIPKEFYKEIASNKAQHEEWVRLFAINEIKQDLATVGYSDPLTPEFLTANPSLVIDTRHFPHMFTDRLLQELSDLDERIGGVVMQSENFQALALAASKHEGTVKCIYIDPPYNTDAGPIDYKNGYRSSSWLSMVEGRIDVAKAFLSTEGILCVTIDDYQVHELAALLDSELGRDNQLGTAIIRNNPSGRSTVRGISVCHEYAFFYQVGDSNLERLPRTDKQLDRFSQEDGIYVDWRNFRKDGGAVTHRAERPKQFYPIYVRPADLNLRIPPLSWNQAKREWDVLEEPKEGEVTILPIDENGKERVWSLNRLSALKSLDSLQVRSGKGGQLQIYRRHIPSEGVLPRSWWDKKTYAAREYGSAALTQLFGEVTFSFAKSPYAVQDCIWVSGLADESNETVLDFFAGSGTTGHAVINLNREDGGGRKFILVEMADYVDTVLLPRLKKVVFAPEWKDGKPTRIATSEEADRSPGIVKVVLLESYEDTLNNLDTRRTKSQASLLDAPEVTGSGGLKEEYLLRYMLDVETRGSQSLLNISAFSDPTAYRLKIRPPGSDQSREVNVDLIETFNYLTGLAVRHIAIPQSFQASFKRDEEKRLRLDGRLKQDEAGPWWFRTVDGETPDGRKTLVIWRKLTGDSEQDNLVLDEWFTRQGYSTKDYEFDLIFVNGDNNLENLRRSDETWKVRLIEEDFHRLMFDVEGV